MNLYIDNKIESWFSRSPFYQRILARKDLIENCSTLTNEQRVDLKFELLIAGRHYQYDSDDIQEKLIRRLKYIDSKIPDSEPSRILSVSNVDDFQTVWPRAVDVEDYRLRALSEKRGRRSATHYKSLDPSNPFEMKSPISDIEYTDFDIDETDADRTLTEEYGSTIRLPGISRTHFSDSESTTDSTGTFSINFDETRARTESPDMFGSYVNAESISLGTSNGQTTARSESISSHISASPTLQKRIKRN